MEAKLKRPIARKVFLDWFYARFFPLINDMEQRFIELRKEGMIVAAYAVEFL